LITKKKKSIVDYHITNTSLSNQRKVVTNTIYVNQNEENISTQDQLQVLEPLSG